MRKQPSTISARRAVAGKPCGADSAAEITVG